MAVLNPIPVDKCGNFKGFDMEYVPNPSKGTLITNLGSKTDIPIVNSTNAGLATPAMLAATISSLPLETAATFSAITAATNVRIIFVQADETNAGDPTLYFHTGFGLLWIATNKLY